MYRHVLLAFGLVLLTGGAGLGPAWAEEACPVTAAAMMSKSEMTKSLQDRGYVQVRSLQIHDGCYEAKGLDKAGKRFELEVNGRTGEIVRAE